MSNYQKAIKEMQKFLAEHTKELSEPDKEVAKELLIKVIGFKIPVLFEIYKKKGTQ